MGLLLQVEVRVSVEPTVGELLDAATVHVGAAADAGGPGDRARVRLAEIALADGKADECVRFCRQVLARDHEDREAVLRLLGRGYERMNRPRAAAECFAGRLPTQ